MRSLKQKRIRAIIIASAGAVAVCCSAQEQYPKPLIHTPSDHPAAHVLILNVDGLHAVDLARWITEHPQSTLAELSRRGVTYTNAHTPLGDPAVGLLSLITGGTPISTGIISSDGYDRTLSPAGSHCETKGVRIRLASIDQADAVFDPSRACAALTPHELVRVNTMFEVVHEKIGRTAWAGDTTWNTDLLRGPSGRGLDDSCRHELSSPREGDELRVQDVLHWIDGKACNGSVATVPVLFGMTFASIAAAQSDPHMGYTDALGTPSTGLAANIGFVDTAIGRVVTQLKQRQLYGTTWIAVTSSYGYSPMDRRAMRKISTARISQILANIQPGLVTHLCGRRTVMIWLKNSSEGARVAQAISENTTELGVQDIYYGARLALTFNTAAQDSRMPNLILQGKQGVAWVGPTTENGGSCGGMLDEDTHVALLISGAQLGGRIDPTYVPTTQLAPLLLRALGMEKFDLKALHLEHSPALPGIF